VAAKIIKSPSDLSPIDSNQTTCIAFISHRYIQAFQPITFSNNANAVNMKGKHITLPTLQIAAAAFLIMTCQAASMEKPNSQAVDNSNLDARNPEPGFSLGPTQPDGTISAEIPVQDNAKMARSDHVSGGFGRRGDSGDPEAPPAAASSSAASSSTSTSGGS
jgi:hypothetical protein